jgi:hypothetical protein
MVNAMLRKAVKAEPIRSAIVQGDGRVRYEDCR